MSHKISTPLETPLLFLFIIKYSWIN
jgi:hypothetical protein